MSNDNTPQDRKLTMGIAVHSIDAPVYQTAVEHPADDAVIARALSILERRIRTGCMMNNPQVVKDFLRLQASKTSGHEVFGVLFLDAQHRAIEFREMFRGTLTQTSVYPREVVKEALELNAASVILTHNHPSGCLEPSRADELLTQTLKSALMIIDIKVLDHIITSNAGATSLAERGLI